MIKFHIILDDEGVGVSVPVYFFPHSFAFFYLALLKFNTVVIHATLRILIRSVECNLSEVITVTETECLYWKYRQLRRGAYVVQRI